MPKYIHEARFGAPKCYKTGSVLATYPKPLLLFNFDKGGPEIEPSIKPEHYVTTLSQFKEAIKAPPPILVYDLSFRATLDMDTAYAPTKEKEGFEDLVIAINYLRSLKPLPFKTAVLDSITELSESIYRHISALQPGKLEDARKWAGGIGMKVQQVIDYINQFPMNTVCIFHTEVSQDETTKKISEQPMVYSKFRDWTGGKFSQFFYQMTFGGKPILRTKDFDMVRGIGCRWPKLPDMVDPTFEAIYGKEPDIYR